MRLLLSHRAYEGWNLPEAPDYVTFAKKMLLGGYFNKKGARPKEVRVVATKTNTGGGGRCNCCGCI